MRKLSKRDYREGGLIVGAGLVGAFLSKFIDTLLLSSSVWNPIILLAGIIFAYFLSLFFLKSLPF